MVTGAVVRLFLTHFALLLYHKLPVGSWADAQHCQQTSNFQQASSGMQGCGEEEVLQLWILI